MKTCANRNCNKINPQSNCEFDKDYSKKDGLQSWCKSCHLDRTNALDPSVRSVRDKVKRAQWEKNNYENNKILKRNWEILNREKRNASKRSWSKINKDNVNFRKAKRNAQKLKATPPWLTKQQLLDIKEFYVLASKLTKESNTKYEVDHIVPLKGDKVRGLHVPWNLQILTKEENAKKGNRLL